MYIQFVVFFQVGQFVDDRHCSRLRTLIAHYPPVQVSYFNIHVHLIDCINFKMISVLCVEIDP